MTAPRLALFEQFDGGQMFMCNDWTEEVCLEKRLFASPRPKWREVETITDKTALFLYKRSRRSNHVLHGVFVADGKPVYNLEPNAFGGIFPSQVRVKVFFKFPPLPDESFCKLLPGTDRQRKLSQKETHELIASFLSECTNPRPPLSINKAYLRNNKSGGKYQHENRYPSPQGTPMYNGQPIQVYSPSFTAGHPVNMEVVNSLPTLPPPRPPLPGEKPQTPPIQWAPIIERTPPKNHPSALFSTNLFYLHQQQFFPSAPRKKKREKRRDKTPPSLKTSETPPLHEAPAAASAKPRRKNKRKKKASSRPQQPEKGTGERNQKRAGSKTAGPNNLVDTSSGNKENNGLYVNGKHKRGRPHNNNHVAQKVVE